MLWVARRDKEGWLQEKDISSLPCRDLRTIDQLWLASSGGKFGFSVQKQIWIDVGGRDNDLEKTLRFLESVEWIAGGGGGGVPKGEQPIYDLRATRGHLPQKYLENDTEEWLENYNKIWDREKLDKDIGSEKAKERERLIRMLGVNARKTLYGDTKKQLCLSFLTRIEECCCNQCYPS